MTEQERKLRTAIESLLEETEDAEVAAQYLDEIVNDAGCTHEEAVAELKRHTEGFLES